MAIRVLLLLFSLLILTNIVILIVSMICGVNLYKKHGVIMSKIMGFFVLFFVCLYVLLAIIGLI